MGYLIGIDEAGRGPLAGPVAVGAVIVGHGFNVSMVQGVRDSKQLTSLQRDEWYARLVELKQRGVLDFSVSFSSAAMIDQRGIVPAVSSAIRRALARLPEAGSRCEVRLDGGLRAPEQFILQRTIIRGDETEPVISLAAIAAKVRRDRLMIRLAKRYPAYGFEVHKGYGTAAHRFAITREGLSDIHRASFCTRLPH